MGWDVTPNDLAAFVIATVGRKRAATVRDVFALDDIPRISLTSAWCLKPPLNRVVRLTRYDAVRLMTVDGLVATLGPVRRKRKSSARRSSVALPGDPRFARRVAAQNARHQRARADAS